MNLFREQLEPYKKKIGIEKAESTYCGLVADYKSLLLFMKSKKNAEDIVIEELEKSFIEDYYNWMLGYMRFGKLHCLRACQYLEVADVYRAGKRLDTGSSVRIIRVYARIQEAFFPFRRGTAKDNPYRTEIQTPACHAATCSCSCASPVLSYVDLKAITYDNIHTDSDGGTWLMGKPYKNGSGVCRKIIAHCYRTD